MGKLFAALVAVAAVGCSEGADAGAGGYESSAGGQVAAEQDEPGSGGNGGAAFAPVETGDQSQGEGSRLETMSHTEADGSVLPLGTYDTALGFFCHAMLMADGSERCVPVASVDVLSWFLDSTCSEYAGELLAFPAGSEPPEYATSVSTESGIAVASVFATGERVPAVYRVFYGTCERLTAYDFYMKKRELVPPELAEVTLD